MTRRPCKTCGRGRSERFYRSTRSRICLTCQTKTRRATSRALRVATTYGLSRADYDALLAHQRGVCAICGGRRTYALDVDHDHATGKVRGLLCRQCNRRLLPAAKDNPETLRNAANYLEWPPVRSLAHQERTT